MPSATVVTPKLYQLEIAFDTVSVTTDPACGWPIIIIRHAGETPFIIVARETDARRMAEIYTLGIAAELDRPLRSSAIQRSPFCLP